MWLLLLLCWAVMVTSSFSEEPEVEVTHETFIAYKVLEVFPRGRRVVITCHSPQAPPPVTYSLWAGQGTEVAKKMVKTGDPASFSINITLKSRPDLLTYSCQAASPEGTHSASTKLQMYWELWTKPVSQLQANFTLLDRGSGPRVEISCQVSSGSPPITYSLVGKDGTVHTQQRPNYGQPAKFTFTLTNKSTRLQCQAENDISVQFSPFKLVPPGQLPQGAIVVLGSSLISIAAVTCWLLAQAWWTRL
uniref:Chromosome 17 open reading frame 99 n=1 Tax=Mustela putorius furo TaxID=9669 RepID=M3YPG8_MUSPF